MAAGEYTATVKLQDVIAKAEALGVGDTIAAEYDYTDQMTTLLAVNAEGRDIRARAADGSDSCTYEIYFVDQCAEGTTDTTPDLCSLSGIEPESVKVSRTISSQVNRGFTLDTADERCNHIDNQDAFMVALYKHMGDMHVEMNNAGLGVLDANLGAAVGLPTTWTQATASDPVLVPTAEVGSAMVGDLAKVKRLTKARNAYNISLGPLYTDYVMSGIDQGNPQNTEAARFGAMGRTYFDLENSAAITGGANDLFVVNKGAVKFIGHSYLEGETAQFNDNPIVKPVGTTIASPWDPSIVFDLYHQVTCKTAEGRQEYLHTYFLQLKYGFVVSPLSTCNDDYTGIWKFRETA